MSVRMVATGQPTTSATRSASSPSRISRRAWACFSLSSFALIATSEVFMTQKDKDDLIVILVGGTIFTAPFWLSIIC